MVRSSKLDFVKKNTVTLGLVCFSALPGWAATLPVSDETTLEITPAKVEALTSQRPFFWTPEEKFQDLGQMPRGVVSGQPTSVAANSQVVGILTGQNLAAGFQWTPASGLKIVGNGRKRGDQVLAAAPSGDVLAGSRIGSVGKRAIVWSNGLARDLNELSKDLPSGVVLNEAHLVSASGQIYGIATQTVDGVSKGLIFAWSPDQTVELFDEFDIGTPVTLLKFSPSGDLIGQVERDGKQFGFVYALGSDPRLVQNSDGAATEVFDANAGGDLVGAAGTGEKVAFFWPKGSSEGIELNAHLADPAPKGFRLVRAGAISPSGEIVAYGVSASGGVRLVLLEPQNQGKPSYNMLDLGEVFLDATRQSLPKLSMAPNGSIAGSCEPLASACPALLSLTSEELASLEDVTNLFQPGGFNGLTLPVSAALGGVAPVTPTPLGGGLPVTTTGGGGTPFFPTTTTGGGTTTAAPISPVPIPAAIWGLLAMLGLLARPWRWV